MREQIELLASLQKVDREIKEKNDAKTALLGEIQKREDGLQAKKAEISAVGAEWSEKDKLRREKEQSLQEASRKATDKRMRMSLIKNIKELQALQREIDQIKQNNAQIEEELIALMEELEAGARVLQEKQAEVKGLEEEWGAKKEAMEAEIAEIDRAVAESSGVRQALAGKLDGDLIRRYELIFSRRRGVAVVAVSDGICQGCFMNIPPQLWNEIIRNDKLNLCPSCHRILFHSPPAPSDKPL